MLEQTTQFIESHDLPVEIPEDGLISHADLLILNRLGKQKENERRKNVMEQEERKQWTCKPTMMDNARNRSMVYAGDDDDAGRKHE